MGCGVGARSTEGLPNKRLKLTGDIVLMEPMSSCPDGHGTSSTASCAGRRGSLSAIR